MLRVRPGVIVVRHRLGFVLANAGIDQSNIDHRQGECALLLPRDPDKSASAIRAALCAQSGINIAVIIVDSFGRAWRNGTIGTAIGVSGIAALIDLRGLADLFGRSLETSELALGDEIAATASLVMGQTDERQPVALIRGVAYTREEGRASDLVRPKAMDLFQ